MIGALQNAMRLQAMRVSAHQISSRIGTVTSYNPTDYTVKVQIHPEEVLTAWLPLAAAWVGNGWGMFATPSIGDQVLVEFIDSNFAAGVASLRFFNVDARPVSVQSGEWWLLHKLGQSVKLTNDGKLTVSDGHGATIQLDGTGKILSAASQWTHTGPVHITGNVQVDQTLTANTDVIGGGKSLKNHTHGNVENGGGTTSAPV